MLQFFATIPPLLGTLERKMWASWLAHPCVDMVQMSFHCDSLKLWHCHHHLYLSWSTFFSWLLLIPSHLSKWKWRKSGHLRTVLSIYYSLLPFFHWIFIRKEGELKTQKAVAISSVWVMELRTALTTNEQKRKKERKKAKWKPPSRCRPIVPSSLNLRAGNDSLTILPH